MAVCDNSLCIWKMALFPRLLERQRKTTDQNVLDDPNLTRTILNLRKCYDNELTTVHINVTMITKYIQGHALETFDSIKHSKSL